MAMLSDGVAFLSNASSGIEAVIHFGLAAGIAVATVHAFLAGDRRIESVVFCCFGEASMKAHEKALAALD